MALSEGDSWAANKRKREIMFHNGFTKTAKIHKMKATPAKHGGKNGRKVYKIDDEKWTCSCPDFQYRQAAIGGECKHIKAHKEGKKPWEIKG